MRSKSVLLALFGLSVLLGSASCTKREAVGGASAAQSGKLRIVFVPKNTGNPYFSEVSLGCEKAAGEIGADYAMTAPATAEATAQIPILKEQIQRGVDVICLSASSPDALNNVLDEARSKGITVVTVDSDLTGNESHRDAGVLPADFSTIGPEQVELLGSMIGYRGEIAILSATVDAPNQNAWIAGMKAQLKKPQYANMKLVDIVYGDDEPQKSTTEFEALMAKHPNLRGVIAPTSVGLAAAARSLTMARAYPGGKNARGPGVVLTGLSTPNQMKESVRNGVVQKFQLWSPKDAGYIATILAAEIHNGKIKPSDGLEFDAPKIGKRKIGKNATVIAGPLVIFDKNNIEKYDF